MPTVLPTLTFAPAPERVGATIVVRIPTPTVFRDGVARLDASICAIPPAGHIATVVSLGADAGFAPQGTQTLTVTCNAFAAESGLAQAFLAWARSFAGLRIFIEEFSPSLGFMRGVAGPMTTAFDFNAIAFGAMAVNQRNRMSASFTLPIVAGRFYRFWVDSVQSADCEAISGHAAAVSNCSFDFGPVTFFFS